MSVFTVNYIKTNKVEKSVDNKKSTLYSIAKFKDKISNENKVDDKKEK